MTHRAGKMKGHVNRDNKKKGLFIDPVSAETDVNRVSDVPSTLYVYNQNVDRGLLRTKSEKVSKRLW